MRGNFSPRDVMEGLALDALWYFGLYAIFVVALAIVIGRRLREPEPESSEELHNVIPFPDKRRIAAIEEDLAAAEEALQAHALARWRTLVEEMKATRH
jgi:hypothetical protein